jgi:CDGSH-type Zn-finger protein
MTEPVVIRCRDNGPLVIHGSVRVVDAQGNELVPPPGKDLIALCRCGHSQNKPFCDGSHKTCGFQASEPAPPV